MSRTFQETVRIVLGHGYSLQSARLESRRCGRFSRNPGSHPDRGRGLEGPKPQQLRSHHAGTILIPDFLLRSYVLRGGYSDVRKQTSANRNPLGRMLTHKYTFLMLQAVSRKHHRSLFTSSSKITGSDRPWCSNVRNFPFHFRFIAEDCQKGGNINSRLPSGPRIHQSFVTW